jgi:hypothetical protein
LPHPVTFLKTCTFLCLFNNILIGKGRMIVIGKLDGIKKEMTTGYILRCCLKELRETTTILSQ